MESPRNLHIIPGVSGSGKSTMAKYLEQELSGCQAVVPYTTRLPRLGEVDGVDYHFRDEEHFFGKILQNGDGDWTFSKFGDNYYYNRTSATLPNASYPVRILPVSFAAMFEVAEDYRQAMAEGSVTIAPLVVNGALRNRWFEQMKQLRPARRLLAELDEQDEMLATPEAQSLIDASYNLTWDFAVDSLCYQGLYNQILESKREVSRV